MSLTRRQFVKAGLTALAGATLSQAWPGLARAADETQVREFNFRAHPARINLGAGPEFTAWTYNGQVPGPEIRVREGQTVRVILKNDLPEATTIHWHGLPVPNPMDGVPNLTQEPVPPDGTFVYEFPARPAGTFIYHSHFGYQLDQGLYGALIIEPAGQERAFDREYTLLLEDWVLQDGGGPAATSRRPAMGMMGRGMMGGGMMGRGMMGGGMMGPAAPAGPLPLLEPYYDGYAVNGRLYPAGEPIRVRRGERIKLRLGNVSSTSIYDLSLAGHVLTVTHADGNPVVPVEADVLRIGMGERYDVEFTADNPGRWLLAAWDSGLGEGQLRVPVLYEEVKTGQPEPPLFRPGLRLADYSRLQALNPAEGASKSPDRRYRQILSGGMHSPYWTINGRVYPDSDNLPLAQGERIRLGYFNRSPMPHPMHLHGHFFRLVNPGLPPERWPQKDTLIVAPMQGLEVEFTADNPGRWFHHCHNLYHMEAGMADVVFYQT